MLGRVSLSYTQRLTLSCHDIYRTVDALEGVLVVHSACLYLTLSCHDIYRAVDALEGVPCRTLGLFIFDSVVS